MGTCKGCDSWASFIALNQRIFTRLCAWHELISRSLYTCIRFICLKLVTTLVIHTCHAIKYLLFGTIACCLGGSCIQTCLTITPHNLLKLPLIFPIFNLEMRVPFLDHCFTCYYLSIPAEQRCPGDNLEKYLLCQAFSSLHLIPNDILWRPKEGFSDGISSIKAPWFQILQEHSQSMVSHTKVIQGHS